MRNADSHIIGRSPVSLVVSQGKRVTQGLHRFPVTCAGSLLYLLIAQNGDRDMPQTKETVKALLDRLPDDCSLDDVLYHLYVIQAVESGLEDVAHGRVITHDAVAEELRRKWQVGRAR